MDEDGRGLEKDWRRMEEDEEGWRRMENFSRGGGMEEDWKRIGKGWRRMEEDFWRGGEMEEDWKRMEEDGGGFLERREDGKWTRIRKLSIIRTYI